MTVEMGNRAFQNVPIEEESPLLSRFQKWGVGSWWLEEMEVLGDYENQDA